MKIVHDQNKKPLTIYTIEYWYLHFIGDEDFGYDYDRVEAVSYTHLTLPTKA